MEAIFIQQRCVREHSRNICSKIVTSHFIIIISFTITISWIEYSYNSFRHEGWRNCWYDWGFRIIITVRAAFATTVRRNTTRIAARFRHYIFAKILYAHSRAVYLKKLLSILQTEFLLKIYHFPSIWKSLSSTKLAPTLSSIYALTTSDGG